MIKLPFFGKKKTKESAAKPASKVTTKATSKKKSKNKEMTVQDVMPFQGMKDHTLQMKNKGTRALLELTNLINTNLLDYDPEDDNCEMNTVLRGFQSLLNNFPGNRFQIYISSEAMDVDDYVRFLDQKIDEEEEYAFKSEMLDDEKSFIQSHAETHRFTKSFYLITGSDLKNEDDQEEELRELTNEMVRAVKGIGLRNSKLSAVIQSGNEYGRLLFDKLNPRLSRNHGALESYGINDLSPNPIIDRDRYYEIDGYFYHILAIRDFPRDPDPCWMQKLYEVNGHFDVLLDLHKSGKSRTSLEKSVSNEIQSLETDLERPLSPSAKKRKSQDLIDADMVLDEITSDEEEIYRVSGFVLIRAETLEGLEKLTRRVEKKLRDFKAIPSRLEYEGLDGFFSALPIMHESSNNLYERYGKIIHSRAVSGFYPFVRTDYQMSTGIRRGINTENKSLVIVDRMDRKVFKNGNGISIGMSGTGKTTAAEMDILRELAQGYKIRVVTPEPGFSFPFGTKLNLSQASKWVLNPFHCNSYVVDADEDEEDIIHPGEYLRIKVGLVMQFFNWLLPSLNDYERSLLHKDIIEAYKKTDYVFTTIKPPTEFPTMETLVSVMNGAEKERIRTLLDKFVDGAYAKLFNGHRNWEKDDLFVANVRDVPLEILPPTMELLIQDIWEEIKLNATKKKPDPYGAYVDELWYFGDENKPQTLEFIFQIYKRIRKYYGYAEALTQNVTDLNKHPKLKAIFNNAVFHRYFPMRFEDVSDLKEIVPLTNKEIKFLQSQNEEQGTNLFIIGEHRMKTQTNYNMEELRILDPKKYALIQKVGIGNRKA